MIRGVKERMMINLIDWLHLERKRNLDFILQEKIVIGSAAVASPEKSEATLTKLWHMRLRRMSEKNMTVLSKQGLLGGHKVVDLEFCEHCIFGKERRIQFCKVVR